MDSPTDSDLVIYPLYVMCIIHNRQTIRPKCNVFRLSVRDKYEQRNWGNSGLGNTLNLANDICVTESQLPSLWEEIYGVHMFSLQSTIDWCTDTKVLTALIEASSLVYTYQLLVLKY